MPHAGMITFPETRCFLCLDLITKPSQALRHVTFHSAGGSPMSSLRNWAGSLSIEKWVGCSGNKGSKGREVTIHAERGVCTHRTDPPLPQKLWGSTQMMASLHFFWQNSLLYIQVRWPESLLSLYSSEITVGKILGFVHLSQQKLTRTLKKKSWEGHSFVHSLWKLVLSIAGTGLRYDELEAQVREEMRSAHFPPRFSLWGRT